MKIPTHCIHGHELTPENLYVGPKRWGCRPCGRAYQSRYLAGETHKTTRTRRPLEDLYTVAESGCWEWNVYRPPSRPNVRHCKTCLGWRNHAA